MDGEGVGGIPGGGKGLIWPYIGGSFGGLDMEMDRWMNSKRGWIWLFRVMVVDLVNLVA